VFSDLIRIPAEWNAHSCCWMAWAVHREWGSSFNDVKRELREIILTVAEYEPVKLLTPRREMAGALAQCFGSNVEIIPAPVDDIWMRDIAPIFAFRRNEIVAIDWNFNGWGSTPQRRSRPGDRLAEFMATDLGISIVHAPFVAEGGAIATDGEGTIVTTKSCLLNSNRNPRFGRSATTQMLEIEKGFSKLGGRKVIWLEGDANEAITSGHVDGYVVFAESGLVLVEAAHHRHGHFRKRMRDISTLQQTTCANGRPISLKLVQPPRSRFLSSASQFVASSYLNIYVTNRAVITGAFGDPERDEAAKTTLKEAFPSRDIRMLRIDHIAAGGGGIRCLTQPEPVGGIIEPRPPRDLSCPQ
jgi:agmatine deiminase